MSSTEVAGGVTDPSAEAALAYPEPRRRPRINRQKMRIEAALAHKAAREAAATNNLEDRA